MNNVDHKFLKVILGSPGKGSQWRSLSRRNSLLTLTRNSAPRGLPSLYRPQRLLAKISYGLICVLDWFQVPALRWGEELQFAEGEGALITELEERLGAQIVSLLIGNSVQEQRRFLGLIEWSGDQSYAVIKVGFTESACDAVNAELALLSEFGGQTPGVPKVVKTLVGQDGRYVAFVLKFIDGKKATRPQALALLGQWLQEGSQPLSEFSEWFDISRNWKRAGLPDTVVNRQAGIQLVPSLAQGDYAPWNLLVDGDGVLWALDWEAGTSCGIPALDWVHYLYQVEKLLNRRDFLNMIQVVERLLQDHESKKFLELVGWGGESRWLIMVYLATNWLIEEEERPILLKEASRILFLDWNEIERI